MFTDIAGYTALSHRDEPAALRLLQDQERLVRGLLEIHRGRLVKSIGDGLLIEFANALDAVECAVDLQRHVQERNGREPPPDLRVRIGIHMGDVEGVGADILGDAVNVASRIEPLAEPGGVCLSEPVYGLVRHRVSFQLESLGPRTLKGVQEPLEVYRIVVPERTVAVPVSGEASGPPRLAVLPLANISPDPKDEYFADGLTEELISVLSRLPDLRVIARTSVNQYRSTGKPVTQIGTELRVTSVLEGSVRKSGNRLRITLQLIDVASQEHRWSDSYDRELGDVFAIQAAVAQEVSEALKLRLFPSEWDSHRPIPTSSSRAYALCLKGSVTLARSDTEQSLKRALDFFEAAITEDPRFPVAHVGVARCLHWSEDRGYDEGPQAIQRAKASASAAVQLDPRCAEAHEELGSITTHEGDWAGAEKELRLAIQINPSLADAHYTLSQILHNTGRPQEAMAHALQALELDPLSVKSHMRVAVEQLIQGRYDEAVSNLQNAIEIAPDRADAHGNLAVAYAKKGLLERALEEIRVGRQLEGGQQPRFLDDAAWVYAHAGRREEAQQILRELTREAKGGGGFATVVAGAYAILGDREKAFEWLKDARQRSAGVTPSLLDWVWFDSVRDDPRFQSFLGEMGMKLRGRAGT